MYEPIEINFYDDNNEVIATYAATRMPFRMVRRAAEIQSSKSDVVAGLDAIAAFIVEFFGGKFTTAELYTHADAGEIMTCYRAILNRIKSTIKGNF